MPHSQSFSVEDTYSATDTTFFHRPRSTSGPPVFPSLDNDDLHRDAPEGITDLTQPWAAAFPWSSSPSALESSVFGTPTPLVQACRAISSFPFPHQSSSAKDEPASPRVYNRSNGNPHRRCYSSRTRLQSPFNSPDRFIPSRRSPLSSTGSFHLSKPPQSLTGNEKLLRQRSASPDPFSPRSPSRLRNSPARFPSHRPVRRSRAATTNGGGVLGTRTESPSQSNRHASFGAVWNVGGITATTTGPMAGVPDGRGGFLGSGTNAPMYTSQFLEGDGPDQDLERHERRLAAALDIDQANRILGLPMDHGSFRDGSPSHGTKRKWNHDLSSRTVWRDNEWVNDSAPIGKFVW